MSSIEILIVDDHEPMRRVLRSLVESQPDWHVCGEAVNGKDAVEKVKGLKPNLVLLDVSMPEMNGLETTRVIRQEMPEVKVILVSQNDPAVVRRQAAEVQAHGYVGKGDITRDLVPAIEQLFDWKNSADFPQSSNDSDPTPTHWLNVGGEMAELIARKNWVETAIGAPENWSPTLRVMVGFLVANRFPLLLWWGPEYTQIYNDAYAPILGVKHPKALGQPVSQCWNEIWHVLQPLIDTPFKGGPATWIEDLELEIRRSTMFEETHFTVAYSPVPDETAPTGIGGVLATVHEITEKIIGERRVAILRDLGAGTAETKNAEQACTIAADVLSKYPKDFPFALLYLTDDEGHRANLVSCAHSVAGDPGSPLSIELQGDSASQSVWPLSEVVRMQDLVLIDGLTERFKSEVPPGAWADPPEQAVVIPIRSTLAHQFAGFLVAGISSRLKWDESYRSFLDLAARQIATSIANARAYEEERKRAEALAEIDRAKTAFFSNVSHEFRTPLTLMMGPLEDAIADSEGMSDANRERLHLAHRNSLRQLKLVNTLLDFSRIEAGRIQASYEPTDLCAFTTELASVFRSAIERAGMRLAIDCPKLPEMVYIDREMWEKIVLNLLSNAFKFSFEGEIRISLRPVGSNVELAVADSGTGIPEDEIPKLFERFHRVKRARGRSYEGSGIGLALVQELVKLHGGSVHVESTVDKGSTFTVTIPFGKDHLSADRIGGLRTLTSTGLRGEAYVQEALRWLPARQDIANDVKAAPLLTQSKSSKELHQPAYILLADDNADMREYVQRLLCEQYEVAAVADGEAALKSARERRPDLILSDVMMPRMDGFELLRTVRADQDLKSIPVILLSARAGEESRVEGLDVGANDYLVKPFSARVGSHLAMARVRREATDRERELRADAELERSQIRTLFMHANSELEDRNADVLRQSEELRELSWRLLRTQDEERRHIARELHDSAGQTLAVLGMNLAMIVQEAEQNAPDIAESAQQTQELVQQLTKEIRTTSYLLHPPLLDENGLPAALSWYIRGLTERSGLDVAFTISEEFGRLPRDMELVVFRLVQECLTNIHRHSGSKRATIQISREPDRVLVEVRDQGKGISPEKLAEIQSKGSGVGIRGMRERLRQFKGDMIIDSNSGGTTVVVTIPVTERLGSSGTWESFDPGLRAS